MGRQHAGYLKLLQDVKSLIRKYKALKADAHAGGTIAGDARKALEKKLKRPIVSNKNYLRQVEGMEG